MKVIRKLLIIQLLGMLISITFNQALATETPQQVTCKNVIIAADAVIKAKQDALDQANLAIKQQSEVITGTTKELDDTKDKLNSLPHNTYAIGGIGITSGILLGSGAILPGVGIMVGIIIIGLFK